jgi:hypothetical protein
MRLGGPRNRSGRNGEEKNLAPTETRNPDLSAVQPIVRRYTDWASDNQAEAWQQSPRMEGHRFSRAPQYVGTHKGWAWQRILCTEGHSLCTLNLYALILNIPNIQCFTLTVFQRAALFRQFITPYQLLILWSTQCDKELLLWMKDR